MDTLFSMRLQIPGLLRPLQRGNSQTDNCGSYAFVRCSSAPVRRRCWRFNEPETSLHPDILDALAHLIVRASKNTQLWITTHSEPLADRIEQHSSVPRVRLRMAEVRLKWKSLGSTSEYRL